jgi:hypothetical protein
MGCDRVSSNTQFRQGPNSFSSVLDAVHEAWPLWHLAQSEQGLDCFNKGRGPVWCVISKQAGHWVIRRVNSRRPVFTENRPDPGYRCASPIEQTVI